MKNAPRRLVLMAIALSLCWTHVTAAQQTRSEPYTWQNVKVVAGGFIPGVVFSRVEKGLAYCRTDIGGCYRWDAAQQRWLALTDNFGESNYFGGESIAPDPIDANTVYIAAGMYSSEPAAMLRSRDRGKTWDAFPVPFAMGGNEDGRGLGERLAVDPNDNRVLYFGSRHDGLWTSADAAATWRKVESFPLAGLGKPAGGRGAHAGLGFVVFDPSSGSKGALTNSIFVGSADPGEQHLFRSDDGGRTWRAVEGQPDKSLLPAKAEIDEAGGLFITYGNGIGPNGVSDGAVWKLDTRSGKWTDITPDKAADRPRGGYCGLSLDRQRPGTLAVATMNRWSPSDTVWRSTDGGATWTDIVGRCERDVSLSPYLLWGNRQSRLGWWMSALAIDPFDSDHAAYATGATIYGTGDFSMLSERKTTHWSVWADGIEETAIITLMSPADGAHLLSGFGDIGGFVHEDLNVSPQAGMYTNPIFGNTNTLEYAGGRPSVIVRSGRPQDGQAPLGYSEDGGRNWKPLEVPETLRPAATTGSGRRRAAGTPAIIVSADGQSFVLASPAPLITRDRGRTWTGATGLPTGARPVADKVDAMRFHALDLASGRMFTSADGGSTFSAVQTTGLPENLAGDLPRSDEAAWPLMSAPGKTGELWLVSRNGLFQSTDGGASFSKATGSLRVEALSFGKAPVGSDHPALFAIGRQGTLRAIWRSDDSGSSWLRVNDEQHQYGTRFRCIAGDLRVFGRVYVGTDGRGIVYGEPAAR